MLPCGSWRWGLARRRYRNIYPISPRSSAWVRVRWARFRPYRRWWWSTDWHSVCRRSCTICSQGNCTSLGFGWLLVGLPNYRTVYFLQNALLLWLAQVGRVPLGQTGTAVSTDQEETVDHCIIWKSNNIKSQNLMVVDLSILSPIINIIVFYLIFAALE